MYKDYNEKSKFHDKTNKKVIGKIKAEAAGQIIKECVGLRSKMYSFIKNNRYIKEWVSCYLV